LLEEMFRHPLSDAPSINRRSAIFQYFSSIGTPFPFQREFFDIAERYLSVTDERTRLSGEQQNLGKRLTSLIAEDNEYKTLYRGITALIEIFQNLHSFLKEVGAASPYQSEKAAIETLLAVEGLPALLKKPRKGKLPYDRVVVYDSYLRFRHREVVRRLLQHIYQLDVYISVGRVAVERGFVFPLALAADEHRASMQGIYHPQVRHAIPNTLDITADNHVLFLTGANMAGKSTFMKTVGITLFLAHMGFPVPASRMEFSVLDGIYSTINLPDDLGMGASHFYAEVQRVKKIAGELGQGRRLFVIFDELFRGTNVKDAYEATIALTAAFAGRRDSILVLSTHIIEAGEVLAQQCPNIDFIYLPTRMEGSRPVYSYKLEKGITADRHGMVIINNEGVLDILRSSIPKTADGNGGFAVGPAIGFAADKQTLDDLNLTGKYKPGSVYGLFNQVQTEGAERLLDEMFRRPLSDPQEINRRSSLFLYLQGKTLDFPFTRQQLGLVEEYLNAGAGGNKLATTAGILRQRIMEAVVKDEAYDHIRQGVEATIDFLHGCRQWLGQFDENEISPIRGQLSTARRILADPRLADLAAGRGASSLSWQMVARYHHLFGHALYKEISHLCEILYELDLGIAVSKVARQKGFTYAQALPKRDAIFRAVDLRHPALDKGVGNAMTMGPESNVLFLTGANMAGKSTLMKAFGIAVYLAHMGFPVAAREMVFSVKEGLYSSINVPDNLSLGYSHFYAEVQRVKQVAAEVSSGKALVVIFDELFKGTNVKDAYDATLAVTATFSGYNNCWFLISTHITEVGEVLKETQNNLQFSYLPTMMDGSRPRYTYQLEEGISTDRHGMMIIGNEGILEIINR
jgi:adenylylsulfate kinase-like enzyme